MAGFERRWSIFGSPRRGGHQRAIGFPDHVVERISLTGLENSCASDDLLHARPPSSRIMVKTVWGRMIGGRTIWRGILWRRPFKEVGLRRRPGPQRTHETLLQFLVNATQLIGARNPVGGCAKADEDGDQN